MLGNKLLLAAAAYVAWTVVTSVFSSKKWDKIREEIEVAKENGEDTKKVILNNFIDTHVNALDWLKAKYVTDENKALFDQKVVEIKSLIKDLAKEGESLLVELQDKWWDYTEEAKQNLKKTYSEKKAQVEELAGKPDKMEKLKAKLTATYKELKEKIEK